MVVSTRIVLSLLGVLGAIQAGLSYNLIDRYSASYAYPAFAVIVFLAFAVGWMVGGLAGKSLVRGFKRVERAAQTRSAGELTVAALGLLVGLLVSALLWFPVHTLPYIGNWVILPLFLVVGYLFAYVAAKKHRGILRLVGVHQVAEPGVPSPVPSVSTLVDTSAIIDGRIADIVRTGFLRGELVVPEFVLKELQQVADSVDPLKRARGRRGLEVVQGLRSEVTVATPDVDFPDLPDVDAKLLKLAKQRDLRILTTDYNLNRLAKIQDVVVLNVNELANALKPAVLPGERLEIRLIREGKEYDQGVGYLDDGTMVVVEGGRRRVGDTVDVQVTSVLQSPSGKMIFTRIGDDAAGG
ncbi:MAG TPA: TRAM domain-containing protein [Gaiellales bacterium]|nr:TRAM domain-containing protein [Gaiellales bacterium]